MAERKKGGTVEANGIKLGYEICMNDDSARPYAVITGLEMPTGYIVRPSEIDLVIPSEIDGVQVASIGNGAFSGCYGLGSVTIPDGVTSIGNSVFSNCLYLSIVTIADSVTSIGDGAFLCCKSLTSVTIPDSVTSIGDGAFQSCFHLKSVTIPDGVTRIGEWTFGDCGNLTGLTIPDGVTSIGKGAFNGCCGLTGVMTIPSSVTSIGDFAFERCRGLTSLTIPDGVTSIGEGAFSGCRGLTGVMTIPSSVTSIGERAFEYCTGLSDFIVGENNTTYCSVSGLLLAKDGKTLISGRNGDVTIPDCVTSIGKCAFKGCSGLMSLTIPDSVTSIEGWAFKGCSGLTSLTIPDGVTSIGEWAFSGCSGLTSLTIPDGVTSIEEWTFGDCSGLTSLTIPDGVTSIGKGAFKGCEGVTSVTIPDSVTGLEEWAFEDCSGLAKVSLPGHLKGKVPRNVFVGCAPGRRIVYRGGTTTTKTTDENQATHTAVLEVYTFAYSIGFKKIDSFDELDGMDYEDFRDAMGCTDWFGCDVGDIESAKLCVDGEEKTINLFSTQKIEEGKQNSWDTFRGERGIYFNDVDKRGITATCSFTGDFDPSKLRFGYQTVVWGAENLKLLSDVTYAGMPMELDVDDDADGKGCYFLLVDGDRYAEYYFGRDVSALKWQPIPSEENQAKGRRG